MLGRQGSGLRDQQISTPQKLLGIPSWNVLSNNPTILVGLGHIPLPFPDRPHLIPTQLFRDDLIREALTNLSEAIGDSFMQGFPYISQFEPEALLVLQSAAEGFITQAFEGALNNTRRLLSDGESACPANETFLTCPLLRTTNGPTSR